MMGGKKGPRSSNTNGSSKNNRKSESIKSTEAGSQSCSGRDSQINISDSNTNKKNTCINIESDDDDLMCLNDIPGYSTQVNTQVPKGVSNRKLKRKAYVREHANSANADTNPDSSNGRYKTRSSTGRQGSNACTDNKAGQSEVQSSGSDGLKPAIEMENKHLRVKKNARMSVGRKRKSINQNEFPSNRNLPASFGFMNESNNRSNEVEFTAAASSSSGYSNLRGNMIKSEPLEEMNEHQPVKKIKLEPVEKYEPSDIPVQFQPIEYAAIKSEPKEEVVVKSEPLSYNEYTGGNISFDQDIIAQISTESLKATLANVAKFASLKVEPTSKDEFKVKSEVIDDDYLVVPSHSFDSSLLPVSDMPGIDVINSTIVAMREEESNLESQIAKSSSTFDKGSNSAEVSDDDDFYIVYDSTMCNKKTASIVIDEKVSSKLKSTVKPLASLSQEENIVQGSSSEPILKKLLLSHKQKTSHEDISCLKPALKEQSSNLKELANINNDNSNVLGKDVDNLVGSLITHVDSSLFSEPALKKNDQKAGDENSIGIPASNTMQSNEYVKQPSTESVPARPDSISQLAERSALIQGRQTPQVDSLANSFAITHATDVSQQDKENFEQSEGVTYPFINSDGMFKNLSPVSQQSTLGLECISNSMIKRKHQVVQEHSFVGDEKNLEPIPPDAEKVDPVYNTKVPVCNDGILNTKGCSSVQLQEPDKLNLKPSEKTDGASSFSQSAQTTDAVAMPPNYREILHFLQQMGDDSTDSEKSSSRLEENVKNIIQRLSSPKIDSNSVSDVELDGSSIAAENSKSINFTKPSEFGLNSKSTLLLCPESSSVLTEDQNKQSHDASTDGIKDNQPVLLSAPQPEHGVAAKVLKDNKDEEEQADDPTTLSRIEAELKRLLSRGMLIDNMSGMVTLSINHFIKYFLKVYGEKTNAAKELRECRQEIKSHNQHVEETQKRIDQLRAAMRVHIMQQEAYYRHVGWHRRIDTRTVGVNVRILEDPGKESSKVSNDEFTCSINKVSEEFPSPFVTDDASVITATENDSRVKNKSDVHEAAIPSGELKANAHIPTQKTVNIRKSATAPLNIVCSNVTQQKGIGNSSVSTHKVIGSISQLQIPISRDGPQNISGSGNGPLKAVSSSNGPQKVVSSGNDPQKNVVNRSESTQRTQSADSTTYSRSIVKDFNLRRNIHLNSQGIRSGDGSQKSVDIGNSESSVFNGGPQSSIGSVYAQNANGNGSFEKAVNVVGPLKVVPEGNQPQISIRSYGSQKADHTVYLIKKVLPTSHVEKKPIDPKNSQGKTVLNSDPFQMNCNSSPPQVAISSGGLSQAAIRSNGAAPVAFCINGRPQRAIRSVTPHQAAFRSDVPPQITVGSNNPFQFSVRRGGPRQFAIRSGGPPRISVRSNGPRQLAIRSGGRPKVTTSNGLASQLSVHDNVPPEERILSSYLPENDVSCRNDPLQEKKLNISSIQNMTCNLRPYQDTLNDNDSLENKGSIDPSQVTDNSDNPQNEVDSSQMLDTVDDFQNTFNNIGLSENAVCNIGYSPAAVSPGTFQPLTLGNPPFIPSYNSESQMTFDCNESVRVTVGTSKTPQIDVDSTLQIAAGSRNPPKKIFPFYNSSQVPVGNIVPEVAPNFNNKDLAGIAFDGGDSAHVTFGGNTAPSHIIIPGNNPPQGMFSGRNPPQGMFSISNPPQGMFSISNPPQGMFSMSNSSQGMFSISNPSQGVFSISNPPQGVFSSTNPPQGVLSSTNPPQGVLSSTDPPQGMLSSTNPSQGMLSSTNPRQGVFSSTNPPQGLFRSSNPPHGLFSNNIPSQIAYGGNYSAGLTFTSNDRPGTAFGVNNSAGLTFTSNDRPGTAFGVNNSAGLTFTSNDRPGTAFGVNNSAGLTFTSNDRPGTAFGVNNSSRVAFSESKSAKTVAASTYSLQGVVRDRDLTQKFICNNNLIGSPQVLMPVDSKVRRQVLRSSRPKPATERKDVEVIVLSSDDEDPPPVIKEKKKPAKKQVISLGKALTTSSSNVPPIPILPSLPPMLRIIPSAPSINAALPGGNMRIVRPNDSALTTRVAYLLPQPTSTLFPQINSSQPAFRAPTPGGVQNVVIFTPIIPTTDSAPQRAIATRPIIPTTDSATQRAIATRPIFKNQPLVQRTTTRPVAAPAVKQIMMTQRAERPIIQTVPQIVANLGSVNSQLTLTPRFTKHPAPLPQPPNYPVNLGFKAAPPRPSLKVNKTSNGIVLSWNMSVHNGYAEIHCYQLYAYPEEEGHVDSSLWKKVNEIKAMPLPMACTLSRFPDGHKYHFTVRAVDIHRRVGPFSDSVSVQLSSTKITPPGKRHK